MQSIARNDRRVRYGDRSAIVRNTDAAQPTLVSASPHAIVVRTTSTLDETAEMPAFVCADPTVMAESMTCSAPVVLNCGSSLRRDCDAILRGSSGIDGHMIERDVRYVEQLDNSNDRVRDSAQKPARTEGSRDQMVIGCVNPCPATVLASGPRIRVTNEPLSGSPVANAWL